MKEQIDAAIKVLKRGGVIVYPTDTIWGIGCDATNSEAVEKIYKIKRRADSKSLILLASGTEMINRYIKQIPEIAYSLIELNDKPMTIVYPGATGLAENVIAEDGSVGIRIPMSDFCIELLKRFRKPVVSTSANISGTPAPDSFGNIAEEILREADYVVPAEFERSSTHKASQILKIGTGGEIEIIRK